MVAIRSDSSSELLCIAGETWFSLHTTCTNATGLAVIIALAQIEVVRLILGAQSTKIAEGPGYVDGDSDNDRRGACVKNKNLVALYINYQGQ